MMTEEQQETRQIEYTPIYERIRYSKARAIFEVGGARSSKSYSVAQFLIEKFTSVKGCRIGVCRKTFPALRMTAIDVMITLLKDYGYYRDAWHNKSYNYIDFPSMDSRIQFFSMGMGEDGRERIKSTAFNYIHIEEANELNWDDYIYLDSRLSAPSQSGEINKLIGTLNPTDENCWIAPGRDGEEKHLIPGPDVDINHSTYKDNPFLEQEYVDRLESYKTQDPYYYKVLVKGEWGHLENIIYTNWEEVEDLPKEWKYWGYGLDFGYENPMALVKCMVTESSGIPEVWIDEILYQTHLTNADMIERLSHFERADIHSDNAPDKVEEVRRAGYNIYPTKKYQGSVKDGIDAVLRMKLKITSRSVNTLKEIRGYRRKEDKDGRVLEEPIEINDHAMDAIRYFVKGQAERFGYATASPIRKSPRAHRY